MGECKGFRCGIKKGGVRNQRDKVRDIICSVEGMGSEIKRLGAMCVGECKVSKHGIKG